MHAFHKILTPFDQLVAFICIQGPGVELFDYHWHEQLELIASLNSRINVSVGSRHYVMNENEIFIVNCSQIHRGLPVPGYAKDAISLNIETSFLKAYCPDYENVYFSLKGNHAVQREIADCMYSLFKLETSTPKQPYYQLLENEKLHHILWLLLTHCQATSSKCGHNITAKYYNRYQNLLSYMNAHYCEPLTLDDAADFANLSREHLSRDFKTYVGDGFHNHLTNIRLNKAQHDLLHTDIPLIDLAMKHGFTDERSYTRAFKKVFEMTPSQYRREFRRNQRGSGI